MKAPDENDAHVVSYLREHPGVSRQAAMRALGVSATRVRRGEAALVAEQAAHGRRRRRRAGVGVAVLALAVAGSLAASALRRAGAENERIAAAQAEQAARRTEGELYAALDRRDPGEAREAALRLAGEDPALRLAGLRYLVRVAPDEHREELAAALEDSDSRVRRAALQLVGPAVGLAVCGQRLVAAALRHDRPLAERLLALHALAQSPGGPQRGLALSLVPLLRDEAVGRSVATALEALAGGAPAAAGGDAATAEATWRQFLEQGAGS